MNSWCQDKRCAKILHLIVIYLSKSAFQENIQLFIDVRMKCQEYLPLHLCWLHVCIRISGLGKERKVCVSSSCQLKNSIKRLKAKTSCSWTKASVHMLCRGFNLEAKSRWGLCSVFVIDTLGSFLNWFWFCKIKIVTVTHVFLFIVKKIILINA